MHVAEDEWVDSDSPLSLVEVHACVADAMAAKAVAAARAEGERATEAKFAALVETAGQAVYSHDGEHAQRMADLAAALRSVSGETPEDPKTRRRRHEG